MRPSSHLCIFLFGTRAQDYTSPDDCPACWVTKACTFICAYFPPNLLLPTSAGGQEVLPFTAASWENKGSSGTALKGSGARKEKWKLRNTLPALSLSFLPCWSLQGWTLNLISAGTAGCKMPGCHPQCRYTLSSAASSQGQPCSEKRDRQASKNLSALGAHLLEEHFLSAVINRQLNVGVTLPFSTCQYIF